MPTKQKGTRLNIYPLCDGWLGKEVLSYLYDNVVSKFNRITDRPCDADLIVTAGWRFKLPSFGIPAINVHPSALPEYPGRKPLQRQVDDQVPYSGLTIHEVIDELDGGPIIVQRHYLAENEDGSPYDLDDLGDFVRAVLPGCMDAALSADLNGRPQRGEE